MTDTTNAAKLAVMIGIVARVQREMAEALAADKGGYTTGGMVSYSQLQAWETSLAMALRDQAEGEEP